MRQSSAVQPFDRIAARVMSFDLSDVKASYAKRYGLTPAQADLHERELKRYLSLCIADPEGCYGMFSDVDNLWHEFICHTPAYQAFCDRIAGRFLHHIPTSSAAAQKITVIGPTPRQQTVTAYEKHFGAMDPALWHIGDPLRADDCCTICTSDKKISLQ
jgi:hypothetical protein